MASSGQSCDVPVDVRCTEYTRCWSFQYFIVQLTEDVKCIDAKGNGRMLDSPIRIEKLSPNNANVWPLPPAHQFFNPPRTNDLDVIVKKQEKFATGIACPQVACSRVVKGFL